MLIDAHSILEPRNITDISLGRPDQFAVLMFVRMQQSDGVDGPWTSVRKGRKPTKRYVRAQYRPQVLP